MNKTLRSKVHFSGIGGTGMVSVARLAIEDGWEVRGSDNPLYPPTSEMVKHLGVQVYEGYQESNLDWEPDTVVVGNALSRGNEEVEAILSRRIRYVSFPEWMKETILRRSRSVAICGTHGKTTTTALTSFLLDRCGFAPGFMIGGQPLDFPHSSRMGGEEGYFVIEGDEYDTAFFDKRAKFFHYLPQIAVVTSVEFDHGDIYSDLDEIMKAFRLMLRQIPKNGHLLLCADDQGAMSLKEYAFSNVITYGFSEVADWRCEILGINNGCQSIKIFHDHSEWGIVDVPLAGEHNLKNTLAAIAVAVLAGASCDQIQQVLPGFKGVKRRMETFHRFNGIRYIDDFAHHPTAIRETIKAAKSITTGRVLVVLEPRSNTMVTNTHQVELQDSLTGADAVWIGPIHRAERIPKDRILDRGAVVRFLAGKAVPCLFEDDVDKIVESIMINGKQGDTVLILSNGSFGNIYQKFIETAR